MSQETLRVLLIEPDADFARFVTEMLAQSRDLVVESHWSGDLAGGLEKLQHQDFDTILLDVSVPDGAGLGSVALIRLLAPDASVLLGGDVDDDTIALEAAYAGAQDYLVKSQLTPGLLERAIRYAVERHRMDRALVAAEERYHSLFDHLVEGIFQTTPDGRYLLANSALARMYGYETPDELIHNLVDIGRKLYVQEGRRDEFIRLMQEHDTLTSFESQAYRKDGSIIWISENCRAIRDNRGQLLYYEGTVEDITQRQLAEEKLKNSEALYHSLVETLPQNIFRKDTQARFTFANQQFCKTLGLRLDEVIGKTDFDFFPKELAEKYQADDRRVLETGQPYDTIEEHRPPGGTKMYVQVVKTPLYGSDGQPLGLQAIFWDITQQQIAEEKIRRVNQQLTVSRKELRLKNMQMEDDLKMAREIQLTLLPQQYPEFPQPDSNGDSAFSFIHRYLPTGSVGGDFFSVSALSNDEAAVFICDVAGHGVRSSLVTAMVRALVEELKPAAVNPGAFLSQLNRDLYSILKHTGTPMLTTAFYLVADWRKGTMRFSNAGHPKPLHLKRHRGEINFLIPQPPRSQPALGLFEDAIYSTSEVTLSQGDLIMLFTDGLFEVHNKSEELYTQGMLLEGVQRHLQRPANELFDLVLAEIRHFSDGGFSDDVCLVGMECAFKDRTTERS